MAKVLVLKRYGHKQDTTATDWDITHNLGITYPVVDVWIEDSQGKLINSDAHEVTRLDDNSITINFLNGAVKGTALIT